jgi:hypothetical protein
MSSFPVPSSPVAGHLQVPTSSSVISTPVGSASSPSVRSAAAPRRTSMSGRAGTTPPRPRATPPPSGPRTPGAPVEAITGRAAPLSSVSQRRAAAPAFDPSRGLASPPCRVGAHPPPRRGHAPAEAATEPAMANQRRRRILLFLFYTCPKFENS